MGATVVVYEAAEAIEPVGAGIQLSPNATKVVRALDLESAVNAHASAPRSIAIRDGLTGALLAELPLGRTIEKRYGAPYLTIHRGDLQAVLIAAARTNGIAFELGARVTGRSETGALTFERRHASRHDLVVAADGIGSVFSHGARNRSGWRAWRALVASDDLPDGIDRARTGLWLVPSAHLVHYPVRSGQQVNLVLVLPDGLEPHQLMRLAGMPQAVIERAAKWRDWPVEDRFEPQWTAEGFAMVGDAAHAMWPYAAQGGAMAIEDGWTLALRVAAEGAGAGSLLQWERERRDRVRRVASAAKRNRFIYHAGGSVRFARNAAMRMTPPAVLGRAMEAIYDWEPPAMRSRP